MYDICYESITTLKTLNSDFSKQNYTMHIVKRKINFIIDSLFNLLKNYRNYTLSKIRFNLVSVFSFALWKRNTSIEDNTRFLHMIMIELN